LRTERADAVDPGTADAARALWSRAEDADRVAPVSEAFALALGPARAGVAHLLRLDGDELVGYGQVAGTGADASAELVVDPGHRRSGHGRALLEGVLAAGARSVWAHGDLPAARALAAAAGMERTRSLYLMGRPLTDADAADPVLPEGYSVRAFEPGRDDEVWVRLNATAFAHHPEQGRLTVDDLHERMAQPWFDPAGFLLVEREGRLVAFHWTKVDPTATPALRLSDRRKLASDAAFSDSSTDEVREVERGGGVGEVYVVGVHPDEQGHGLGGPLTGLGLAHLARRGVTEVHLYVDGDNTAARRTYTRLGFTDLATDGQYARADT
jgi:mycothiol synthase